MKVKTKMKGAKGKKLKYTCPHCDKQFADRSSWCCHVSIHTDEQPFKCELCDYKCKVKKYLSRHKKKAHTKPTGHQCTVCGKCFHFECKLRDHMRVHTGEKPYKCNHCDKAFSSSYSLNNHKYIHTGEKPFQCRYCEYSCRDNSTIRRHMERHMGISKDYPCLICNKNFKKKGTLQMHMDEIHFELDTRKFPCEQCDKVFKTKGTLSIHIRTIHTKGNRIKCEICGCKITKNNVLSHMRRHIDVKPYKCSYKPCGRRFKDKGDLKKHSLIHYPDRQYLCTVCDRRFARRARWNEHKLLHLNEKYVQCDHCGVMFSTKIHLSRHIQKKHGANSKEYICDICGLVAYSKRSIIMHLKYGHGTEHDTKCKICNKDYRKYLYIKEHYLRRHNIKYSLLPKKKEGYNKIIIIKPEPFEEFEVINDDSEFMYEVQVEKQECDEMEDEDAPLRPKTPSPSNSPSYTVDSDTITYSKKVLSEDISRSLLERDKDTPEDAFDDFFIGHVMKKPEEHIVMPRQIVDKKRKERVEKCLEKLLSEVRKRKECKALEKLRKKYNRRIKNASKTGNKKEQKSIRYYKKPAENKELSNSTNDVNSEVTLEVNGDNRINEIDCEDDKNNDNINADNGNTNINIDNDKNTEESVEKEQEIDVNDKISDVMNNDADKSDDEDIHDDDFKDSDFEIDSDEDEVNNHGKLKFNTHQCYICFKLFKTKTELTRHCMHHFDLCNEKMLKKCPFCGYVTNLQITKHIRMVHNVEIEIPYGRITERDTQHGSKYVYEINKDCDLEIIPSIINLNKIASMKIDEKNRESKNIFMGTTKLVRKGNGWMVERQPVSVSKDCLLPEFTDEDYLSLKYLGNSYLERIRNLSILGKKKGVKILYPCEGCDKICLTFSALKLHNRKHEANPKAFKPKVWKNKILNGYGNKSGKVSNKTRKKCGNKDVDGENQNCKKGRVTNTKHLRRGKLEVIGKNGNILKNGEYVPTNKKLENRFADPNPVKNKHKCDKELIEFYKNNIKGGDIEFWQFLKIFNKMSRENVNDFKDLENRYDFGMHNIIIDAPAKDTAVPADITPSNPVPNTDNSQITRKKTGKIKKKVCNKSFTRAIMISKKEYLRRIEIKNQMRRRLQESAS